MPTRVNALAVMAKAPVPGQVKTRLVPPFTEVEAAELYRCLLLDQLENLGSFAGADLFIAYTPEDAASFFTRIVPARVTCFPQVGDDLGVRMNRCIAALSEKGYRSIVLLGSDLPPVPHPLLAEAFQILNRPPASLVLGPSRDGGYYLIGMNRPTPQVFRGMDWGSDRVFSDTVARLKALTLPVGLLPTRFDIDTIDDIHDLAAVLEQAPEFAGGRVKQFLNTTAVRKFVSPLIDGS